MPYFIFHLCWKIVRNRHNMKCFLGLGVLSLVGSENAFVVGSGGGLLQFRLFPKRTAEFSCFSASCNRKSKPEEETLKQAEPCFVHAIPHLGELLPFLDRCRRNCLLPWGPSIV